MVTEFQSLIGTINVSGIATSFDGVPYIVISDRKNSKDTEEVVRHDYTHVLLSYKNFPFPPWFDEGFAELMSMTT